MQEGKPGTPEPIDKIENGDLRKRVVDMGLIEGGDGSNATSRELELANMVMHLTNGDSPDPSQLALQAETISCLLAQRDILLRRSQEQREKYEAELEGFQRSAEALISTRTIKESGCLDENLKRQCAAYEQDNRHLLEKLAESQSRFNCLESELNSLRPYLLMHPDLSLPSVLPLSSSSTLSSRANQRYQQTSYVPKSYSSKKSEGKRKAQDFSALGDTDHSDNDEPGFEYSSMPNVGDYSGTSYSSNHYRRSSQSTPNNNSRKLTVAPQASPTCSRKRSVSCSTAVPFLGDARAEHLLLAVRKLGKKRVEECLAQHPPQEISASNSTSSTSISTSNQNSTPKSPKLAVPSPKTPRRAGTHLGIGSSAMTSIGQSAIRNKQPQSSSQPSTRTPLTQAHSKSKGRTQGDPPTPMDSLVSAARSMMEGSETSRFYGPTPSTVGSKSRRWQAPESPVPPKKRKVGLKAGSDTAPNTSARNAVGGALPSERLGGDLGEPRSQLGRTKSALDVLADQAAVFSSQENEDVVTGPSLKPAFGAGPVGGKGKSPAPLNLSRQSGSVRWDKAITTSPPAVPSNPRIPLELTDTDNETGDLMHSRGYPPSSPTPLTEREMAVYSIPSSPTPFPSSDHVSIPILGLDNDLDVEKVEVEEQNTYTDDVFGSNTGSPGLVLGTGFMPTNSLPANRTESGLGPTDVSESEISFGDNAGNTMVVNVKGSDLPVTKGRAATPQRALTTDDVSSNLTQTLRSNSIPSTPHRDLGSSPVGGSFGSHSPCTPKNMSSNVSSAQMRPGELLRVVGGQEIQMVMPGKRPRSPYVKWSQEEDDLLAQAVAKYGQKWDLVQKALPSRGYHQVRQRWLRKLGVFDPKPDVTTNNNVLGSPSSRTGNSAVSFNSSAQLDGGGTPTGFGVVGSVLGKGISITPQPKLGLAPLSSELALSGTRGTGR